MSTVDLQWALQRRLEDVFGKLGEKFGDLTGRVEMTIRPDLPFEAIGGNGQAKAAMQGLAHALTTPDVYATWGIEPPNGVLLYGPPGTGKTLLARALATKAGAIFYRLSLMNLTSKFGPNTAEVLQESLRIATTEAPAVFYLDEADALSLEHLLPPPQAREQSARLVAALCEKLDAIKAATVRVLVVAATSRTDAIDPTLVAPGRLDHLIEVVLPDAPEQQEIMEMIKARTERKAGRPLFDAPNYEKMLPVMGGMSGADISVILQRALEVKVQRTAEVGAAAAAGLVTTDDLMQAIDAYKRVRGVVEKIRYGQYL
ncbi:MAG: ATP-binding protein [Candidatus Rokubacteria bacterium]|nr:ATP-binding protein [Candidatus Rokubacteria bacterium]